MHEPTQGKIVDLNLRIRAVPSEIALVVDELLGKLSSASPSVSQGVLEKLRSLNDGVRREGHIHRDAAHPFDVVAQLVKDAGGYFIGPRELCELGKLPADAVIPYPPASIEAFLRSTHPIHNGCIAEHIVLVFDLETARWECLEKDLSRQTLDHHGIGYDAWRQKEVIAPRGKPIEVMGVKMWCYDDGSVAARCMTVAQKYLHRAGVGNISVPWNQYYFRVDEEDAHTGQKYILRRNGGGGYWEVADVHKDKDRIFHLGLMAGWDLRGLA
jgi:hypothetical protein